LNRLRGMSARGTIANCLVSTERLEWWRIEFP